MRKQLCILIFIFLVSVISAECIDSDGGSNIYEKGVIRNGTFTATDECIYNGAGSKSLKEYFCSRDTVKFYVSSCNYGCDNGACFLAEKSSCNDTDDGKNYNIRGVTSIGRSSVTDICQDRKTLREFFCDYVTVEEKQSLIGKIINWFKNLFREQTTKSHEVKLGGELHTCENECDEGMCV